MDVNPEVLEWFGRPGAVNRGWIAPDGQIKMVRWHTELENYGEAMRDGWMRMWTTLHVEVGFEAHRVTKAQIDVLTQVGERADARCLFYFLNGQAGRVDEAEQIVSHLGSLVAA